MEKAWCEICQFGAEAETIKELMKIWDNHTKTADHEYNVIKYLMIDTGAKTIEELPKKFHEYIENKLKQRDLNQN